MLTFKFQRNWDVDIAPTPFNENSYGHVGVHPNVIDSSYYGFENPNPAVAYSLSCAANCNAIGDLGGGIKVGTWTLKPGTSMSFNYFYGINNARQDSDTLTAQMFLADSDYNILSQSMDGGQYPLHGANSTAIGFNSAVPEPASWALMIVGFGMVGAAARRRQFAISA
ncbi:PEP-CTERM sorting domain-containing protein [Polymorphobacter arshaanensis]|uniref:PEP-CTERM sorting domain-containing protein n=1 Tax=Glacieibacterium arshaanense TaxID=2511025 RepID=A0A4Y9ESP6_9SPHN|nr:PEP-CTERM sorting domain-containing protein [Polymorphobacter arshaanensis]